MPRDRSLDAPVAVSLHGCVKVGRGSRCKHPCQPTGLDGLVAPRALRSTRHAGGGRRAFEPAARTGELDAMWWPEIGAELDRVLEWRRNDRAMGRA